jgi:hypothetical protein
MKKFIAIALLAFSVAGCQLQTLQNAYTIATTTTVPANVVIPAANAFDAIKATATNYGQYCLSQKFVPTICSAANRRAVIKFVRAGTAARVQIESSLSTGQPALGTVYNALIAAVNGLQGTPINNLGATP